MHRPSRTTLAIATLSALGSIAPHSAPVLVAILTVSEGYDLVRAAFVVSAMIAGQLAAAATLSLIARHVEGRGILVTALVAFVILLAATPAVSGSNAIFVLWFGIGALSGLLMQAGLVFAANAPSPEQVFSLRLGIALSLAGLVIAAQLLPWPVRGLTALCISISVVIVAASLALRWVPRSAATNRTARTPFEPPDTISILGLIVLALTFVGQVGFLANTSHFFGGGEGGLGTTFVAIGFGKLVIGIAIWAVFSVVKEWTVTAEWATGAALAAATFAIAAGPTALLALLLFMAYELTLNIISSLLHGRLGRTLNTYWKHWILLIALVGATVGPPFAAFWINAGLPEVAVANALLSTLLVLLWGAAARARLAGPVDV